MTFGKFEKIVKEKYPEAKLFKHGEFAGNKINVAVIFNGTHEEKVYQYNGTYCEVLNKLRIKAIYKHNFEAVKNTLNHLKSENGKINMFGITCDNSEEISKHEAILNDYMENYIVI